MATCYIRIDNRTNVALVPFGDTPVRLLRGRLLGFSEVPPCTLDVCVRCEETLPGEGCAGAAIFEGGPGSGKLITINFATSSATGDNAFSIVGDSLRNFKVTAPSARAGREDRVVATFIVETYTPEESAALRSVPPAVPLMPFLPTNVGGTTGPSLEQPDVTKQQEQRERQQVSEEAGIGPAE